jgi:hypothetical protein
MLKWETDENVMGINGENGSKIEETIYQIHTLESNG